MKFTRRQIEIINAATQLIGDTGINNVTTKNLAEEMGFSEPALYRHFSSKTEILTSVIDYFKEQISEGISAIFKEDHTGFENIHELIKYQFILISNQPAIIMIIFAETSFQYDKKLSDAVFSLNTHLKHLLIGLIEKGMTDGSIRKDVKKEDLSTIMLGSMRMTVLQWRLSGYAYNLSERGVELCTSMKLLVQPVKS